MTEYDFHDGYIIDKIYVKDNENRLGIGTRAATIEYHYRKNDRVIYTTDELANEEVEKAIRMFVYQSGKSRDQLKQEGKLYIHDFEIDREKERQEKRKKIKKIIIVVTSLASATVLGVLLGGYSLKSKKANKAEIQPKSEKLFDMTDINVSHYVLQKEQLLYENAFDSNHNSYKREQGYKYCMYVANLLMGGDELFNDQAQTEAMRNSIKLYLSRNNVVLWDYIDEISEISRKNEKSKNRLIYAATPTESSAFRQLPSDKKETIIKRFIEVAETIDFQFNPSNVGQMSDYPSWWVNLKKEKCYDHEKLMNEAYNFLANLNKNEKSNSK